MVDIQCGKQCPVPKDPQGNNPYALDCEHPSPTLQVQNRPFFEADNDNLKITNYDHLKFTKNGKF